MSEKSQISTTPVALVTGGSRGLGRALTLELARQGWTVITDARDSAALARTERDGSDRVIAVPGDIADPLHRAQLVDATRTAGTLGLVVANAGALGPSPLPRLAEVDLGALDTTMAINTTAQLGLAQAVLPLLRDPGGTIAFITSDAAVEAYPGWGVYGASKAALEAIARVLAVEEPAVSVLVIDPGDLRTEMHQAAFPGEDISDRAAPEQVAPQVVRLLVSDIASGRHRVSDVADPSPPVAAS
ncbi:MAG TPA: SDR family oxidoreductase [Microthrixaceae bacterium]|nr:SDR family oxidoreductase [Microthrixaceae bacterium]